MMELVALGDEEAAAEQKTTYLTHLARAALSREGVYPASRPELPDQLASVGCAALALQLRNQLHPDERKRSVRAV